MERGGGHIASPCSSSTWSTCSHETSAHNLFIFFFLGVGYSWSQNDNMATSITWRRRTWRGLDKKQVDCTWHEGTSCHIFTWSVCKATNQFVVFIYQTNCEETLSRQARTPALPQDLFRLCEQNKTVWPNVNAAVDLIFNVATFAANSLQFLGVNSTSQQ